MMRNKFSSKVIAIIALAFLLIALPVLGACAEEETPTPTPAPTPAPAPAPTPTPAPAPALPKLISITCFKVGSYSHTLTSALTEAIIKGTGMEVKIEPGDTDIARLVPLRDRKAEITMLTINSMFGIVNAIGEFGEKEWGPQRLRMITCSAGAGYGIFVRGDSDIYTVADLKGKRYAYNPGSPGLIEIAKAFLAFGDVGWDDTVLVPYGSYIEALDAPLEGTADAIMTGYTAPYPKKLEASPHGVRWLPMPADDEAGWQRVNKIAPHIRPLPLTAPWGCAQASEEEPFEGSQVVHEWQLLAYDFLSEDLAYAVVKALDEHYDVFKGVNPQLGTWTLETMVDSPESWISPYHPGCIKYFKERGVWEAKHEAKQKELLELEDEGIADWKATVK